MKNPYISIIIPIYKVELYLQRCLHSILNQTLKNIEIILVDDGSPDNCPVLCDQYAKLDNRIKVIHKNNEGLGLARNSGMAHATGKYIAFIDSDDFIDIRMFERLYTKAESYNLDTVFCGCNYYYSKSSIIPRQEVLSDVFFTGHQKINKLLLDFIAPLPEYPNDVKYMMSVWHAIYSKELIDKYSIKFQSERFFLSEDILFDIDYLSVAEKVCFIPDTLYYYCQNSNSLSRTYKEEKYEKAKRLILEMQRKLSKLMPQEAYQIHFQRFQLFYLRTFFINALKKYNFRQVQHIISDPFWRNSFKKYPFHRMQLNKRCFYSTLNLLNRIFSIQSTPQ